MSEHLDACAAYHRAITDKYGYEYCEVCGINGNGSMKFEVHHLYMASLYPRHPELHNPRNLVLACLDCHNDFHGKRNPEAFAELEESRGLKKLFA